METIESHIEKINNGEKFEYLYFYGHTPKQGSLLADKSCLSQWYPAMFMRNTSKWYNAEQYMMYHKARLCRDDETLQLIIKEQDPSKLKQLGRQIKNFDQESWDAIKSGVVRAGNLMKFAQNVDLLYFLLNTGDKVLVEAAPNDPIWGVGMRQDDPDIIDPRNWKGSNLLGFTLMSVREHLSLTKNVFNYDGTFISKNNLE